MALELPRFTLCCDVLQMRQQREREGTKLLLCFLDLLPSRSPHFSFLLAGHPSTLTGMTSPVQLHRTLQRPAANKKLGKKINGAQVRTWHGCRLCSTISTAPYDGRSTQQPLLLAQSSRSCMHRSFSWRSEGGSFPLHWNSLLCKR